MSERPTMKHIEASERLADYMSNELADNECIQVEEHIQQCLDCQKVITEIKHIRHLLNQLKDVPVGWSNAQEASLSVADSVCARLNEPFQCNPADLVMIQHDNTTIPETPLPFRTTNIFASKTSFFPPEPAGKSLTTTGHEQIATQSRTTGHEQVSILPKNPQFVRRNEKKRPIIIWPLSRHLKKQIEIISVVAATISLMLATSVTFYTYRGHFSNSPLPSPAVQSTWVANPSPSRVPPIPENGPTPGATATPDTVLTKIASPVTSIKPVVTAVATNDGIQSLTGEYTIKAVPNPDSTQYQVQSRLVHATTSSQSLTVNATGVGTKPGTHATGTVQVSIGSAGKPMNFSAGTTFNSSTNPGAHPYFQFVLDQAVNLTPNGQSDQSVLVPAHVQQIGSQYNVAQNFIIVHCHAECLPTTWSIINTTPFTGGTDPQTYTYVQQSDIDTANKTLNAQFQAPSGNALVHLMQGQISTNEHLLSAGNTSCQGKPTANHVAKDQATTVTVTLSYTCAMAAYDYNGALAAAARWLTNQAISKFGNNYVLASPIKTQLNKEQIIDAAQNWATADISASGTWKQQ